MLSLFLAPINRLCDPRGAEVFCDWELARLAAISSNKRRQEYLAGHSLLRLAAAHTLGASANNAIWQQPANSAPQLSQHPHLTFGLSHSAGWVGAVVEAIEPSAKRVEKTGIDIELERDRKNLTQLANYSFTEDWLMQHRGHLLPAFFQRWTLCEALVKGSQKKLGTELLRHQKFAREQQTDTGHWLYHTRIAPEQTHYTALALNSALHISLCSERHYAGHQIHVFLLADNTFNTLAPMAFSTFKAL
ncbi:hypothetical protein R50072_28670 [Simiduia litorea]|uniref:4'-phosphopantetheinyl transferase family protein n=1 Tax=Simiduia litorea TaxID=1435348 RepID=UPI0036F230C6